MCAHVYNCIDSHARTRTRIPSAYLTCTIHSYVDATDPHFLKLHLGCSVEYQGFARFVSEPTRFFLACLKTAPTTDTPSPTTHLQLAILIGCVWELLRGMWRFPLTNPFQKERVKKRRCCPFHKSRNWWQNKVRKILLRN